MLLSFFFVGGSFFRYRNGCAIEDCFWEDNATFEGRVRVGKLNVFENQETAEKYQITGIPTIIIFRNGEIKERATGLRPKQVIVDKLNSLL